MKTADFKIYGIDPHGPGGSNWIFIYQGSRPAMSVRYGPIR